MTLDNIAASGVGLGVLIGAVFTGWQSWLARREARKAKENAHPVSNGWGTQVSRDLRYLRDAIDRAHARMDEQARRHNTTDQRLAEATSYARTAAEQSSAATAGLASHLADHDAATRKEVAW